MVSKQGGSTLPQVLFNVARRQAQDWQEKRQRPRWRIEKRWILDALAN